MLFLLEVFKVMFVFLTSASLVRTDYFIYLFGASMIVNRPGFELFGFIVNQKLS